MAGGEIQTSSLHQEHVHGTCSLSRVTHQQLVLHDWCAQLQVVRALQATSLSRCCEGCLTQAHTLEQFVWYSPAHLLDETSEQGRTAVFGDITQAPQHRVHTITGPAYLDSSEEGLWEAGFIQGAEAQGIVVDQVRHDRGCQRKEPPPKVLGVSEDDPQALEQRPGFVHLQPRHAGLSQQADQGPFRLHLFNRPTPDIIVQQSTLLGGSSGATAPAAAAVAADLAGTAAAKEPTPSRAMKPQTWQAFPARFETHTYSRAWSAPEPGAGSAAAGSFPDHQMTSKRWQLRNL